MTVRERISRSCNPQIISPVCSPFSTHPLSPSEVVTRNYCEIAQKALDAAGIVVDGVLGDTGGDPDPRWTHYETFEGKKSNVIRTHLMYEFGLPVRL